MGRAELGLSANWEGEEATGQGRDLLLLIRPGRSLYVQGQIPSLLQELCPSSGSDLLGPPSQNSLLFHLWVRVSKFAVGGGGGG